jgi:excisionase family DNA binding protein
MPETLAPRWLKRDEAAAYLGCSVRLLDSLEAAGKLIPSRVLGPKSPRFDKNALDRWMASGPQTETPRLAAG